MFSFGTRFWCVLLQVALSLLLPGLALTDEAPFWSGEIGSPETAREYCLAGKAGGKEARIVRTAFAKQMLIAATAGFRKSKIHARRLSAQRLFSGIASATVFGRFEGGASLVLLLKRECPQRERTPEGTRGPPSAWAELASCFRCYAPV